MDTLPSAFIAAAAAMTTGQAIKILTPLFRGRKPEWHRALQSGGMPSSHTAACAAMALMAGIREGFGSSVFAVAAVLTAVVAHDAVKVRGSLNTIIKVLKESAPDDVIEHSGGLPDTVGHTVGEVIAGFFLAALSAGLCSLWLP